MIKMKCLNCPYRLGLVKCVRTPCIECMREGRKTHPFQNFDETNSEVNKKVKNDK